MVRNVHTVKIVGQDINGMNLLNAVFPKQQNALQTQLGMVKLVNAKQVSSLTIVNVLNVKQVINSMDHLVFEFNTIFLVQVQI